LFGNYIISDTGNDRIQIVDAFGPSSNDWSVYIPIFSQVIEKSFKIIDDPRPHMDIHPMTYKLTLDLLAQQEKYLLENILKDYLYKLLSILKLHM